jgi:hypothetical protein
MKLRWFVPILLGAFFGLALPVESGTLYTYVVKMLPPSGTNGQAPVLTCGWHDGSCGTGTTGTYLDWDNTSSNAVYFRGLFSRGSSPYETNRLIGKRVRLSGGNFDCERQDVVVVDAALLKIRGIMRYLHIDMNSNQEFPIATAGNETYNSKFIGNIINDTGCGLWSGTHVHAGYPTTYSVSVYSTRYKNTSQFPGGDYCTPGVNCFSYNNTNRSNWTHKFTWPGP